ncbi:MAG: HAD family hydrolase [Ruminiclostridium sp.]
MKNIKAVVFDFDGTLYDKKNISVYVALKNIGHPAMLLRTTRTLKAFKGKDFGSRDNYYKALFTQIGGSPANADKAKKWYFEKYLPNMITVLAERYTVRPYVNELMKKLQQQGISVILYSDYERSEDRMGAIQAHTSHIDKIYASADFGGLKPCKEAFERMLAENGLSAENTLIVGDSEVCDKKCAELCGAQFYKVTTDEDIAKLLEMADNFAVK